MGLDVYLYRFETPPVRGAEDDYEGGEKIERDSKVYPEHMFKVGYLRSSYNDGGIENLLNGALGKRPLRYIFDHQADNYEFRPDWGEAMKRAREMTEAWAGHLKRSGGCTVQTLSFNPFIGQEKFVGSEQEAMAEFLATKAREDAKTDKDREMGGWYGNGKGDYYFGPRHLRVRALFPGSKRGYVAKLYGQPDRPEPCFYAIVEGEPDEKPNWYLQALEVTVEMIEWVLGQPDPQQFWLHWSG